MNCKNKKIEPGVGGRRMIIPNSKTSDKILDMIKDGDSWEDIHKTIYANEKMLKKRTKPVKDMMKEQCMKIQLEKQASEESVKSIEKTSYEGFKKYVEMLGQEIGGKESGVGWKGLKNLSKYPLLGGKKENQFQVKVLDKNGNEVSGARMENEVIDYLSEQHKAKDPNDKMEIQKWDFDIEITTEEAKNICRKLPRGKALGWDCVRDRSFELCGNCYVSQECKSCSNKIQRIKDIFKKKF